MDTTNEFSFVRDAAKIPYRQRGIGADKMARVIYDPPRLIRMRNVSPPARKKDFYISSHRANLVFKILSLSLFLSISNDGRSRVKLIMPP